MMENIDEKFLFQWAGGAEQNQERKALNCGCCTMKHHLPHAYVHLKSFARKLMKWLREINKMWD